MKGKKVRVEDKNDVDLVRFLIDNMTNEDIRIFCNLSLDEYVRGINNYEGFLFDELLNTVQQMPDEDLQEVVEELFEMKGEDLEDRFI